MISFKDSPIILSFFRVLHKDSLFLRPYADCLLKLCKYILLFNNNILPNYYFAFALSTTSANPGFNETPPTYIWIKLSFPKVVYYQETINIWLLDEFLCVLFVDRTCNIFISFSYQESLLPP